MKYQAYAEYKDSGVEWLEAIPSHWDIKKLKFIANVQPSNIDKKTNEGEIPILLCNYTDVYYNDTVNVTMEFMKASATEEQIKKFTLQAGDTIITKDSEDPNDIAIPTFVPEDMVGVVCGYHLSVIRPYDMAYGEFIKRLFECGYARAYFATRSNGLTRYGLGTYALDNIFYPKPPEIEATTIANFLDHETAKINTLIEKQQQLIKLLKEKRQAVISHAVTKGLNPNAPMRDSGVEWLGNVPEHWKVCRIKHVAKLESGHTPDKKIEAYWVECDIPWVSLNDSSQLKEVDYISETAIFLNEKGIANSSARKLPERCVVFTRDASIGLAAITTKVMAVSQHVIAWICDEKKVIPEYLLLVFYAMKDELDRFTFGATLKTIGMPDVNKLTGSFPDIAEQKIIIEHVFRVKQTMDIVVSKAEEAIKIIQERRTALISAAVTGKIDVRSWQAPEPLDSNNETIQEVAA